MRAFCGGSRQIKPYFTVFEEVLGIWDSTKKRELYLIDFCVDVELFTVDHIRTKEILGSCTNISDFCTLEHPTAGTEKNSVLKFIWEWLNRSHKLYSYIYSTYLLHAHISMNILFFSSPSTLNNQDFKFWLLLLLREIIKAALSDRLQLCCKIHLFWKHVSTSSFLNYEHFKILYWFHCVNYFFTFLGRTKNFHLSSWIMNQQCMFYLLLLLVQTADCKSKLIP